MLILCADWWLDGLVVADIGTPWENCNRSEHAVNITTLMTQKIDKEWTFICDIWNVADILVLFALSTKKQTELYAGDWSTIPVVLKSHYLTWQWLLLFFLALFSWKLSFNSNVIFWSIINLNILKKSAWLYKQLP